MSRILSNYPPDRWIREIEHQHPGIWAELRKAYADRYHEAWTKDLEWFALQPVPDWCYMPVLFSFVYMFRRFKAQYGADLYFREGSEILSIGSMYVWKASKGVYRFDPELYDILVKQTLDADIPCEMFFRLPEWAVYIETPGLRFEGAELDGFTVHLDYNLFNRTTDLQFALFRKGTDHPRMIALPLGKGNVSDAMERLEAMDEQIAPGVMKYQSPREDYEAVFVSMIQLVLYLCSEKPDMPEIEHPRKRMTVSGAVRNAPKEPKVWDVGVRIAGALRKYRTEERDETEEERDGGRRGSPRPHVRSAHWHTYWTGPRNAQFPVRQPVLRWIPPIPVGMSWEDETEFPTGVHDVL